MQLKPTYPSEKTKQMECIFKMSRRNMFQMSRKYLKSLDKEMPTDLSPQQIWMKHHQGKQIKVLVRFYQKDNTSLSLTYHFWQFVFRSHMLFTMTVQQKNLEDLSSKTGKLFLVDLAGSEKIAKSGAEGKTLDEAKKIN